MSLNNTVRGAVNKLRLTSKNILFIEDLNSKGLYSNLLKQSLPENKFKEIKIESLENKKNVLDCFNVVKENNKLYNKSLFLVDLDFDLIKRIPKVEDRKVFYLEKYTLENYFISEEYGVMIISNNMNKEYLKIAKEFSYDDWLEKVKNTYSDLLPLFLSIQNLASPIETSKQSPKIFFETNNFDKHLPGIKSYLKGIGEKKCKQLCHLIKKNKEKIKQIDVVDFIPGKQLLELYVLKINNHLGKSNHISINTYKTIATYNLPKELGKILKKIENEIILNE